MYELQLPETVCMICHLQRNVRQESTEPWLCEKKVYIRFGII